MTITDEMVEAGGKAWHQAVVAAIHRHASASGGSQNISGSEYYLYPPMIQGFDDAIRSALTAALASQKEEPVSVKTLEWAKNTAQKRFVAEPFPYFKYVIIEDERGVDWSVGHGNGSWNPVNSVDDAKAAAQFDFEKRVRSALFAHPDNDRLREALEAAKKRMQNCRGAIESNQVADKDVHGSLAQGIRDIDAALAGQEGK